jgi:LPXTG-motif cell wall-anchored protein
VLPHTGALVQPGQLAGGALALLGLGLLFMAAGRRRHRGAHRA